MGGLGQCADPVATHRESPAMMMTEVVMVGAHRHQVGEIAAATVAPPIDVMDVAVVEWDVAAVDTAGVVRGAECSSLPHRGQTRGAPDIERHGGTAHHDGQDVGIACELADGVGGHRGTVGEPGNA